MRSAESFRPWLIAALFALVGCDSGVATVELALDGDPPEEVASITVFVTDLDLGFIVASATVTRERTRFPLGVPAERPLEFTLIARRSEPPTSLLGPMPSYVGRVRRRISLGSERELVQMVGRPGGAVTVIVSEPDRGDIDARPRFEVEGSGTRPTRLYDLSRDSGGWRRSIALESGQANVRLLAESGGRQWETTGLVQLRRDEDTLVALDMPRQTTTLEVVPSLFRLALVDPETEEPTSDERVVGQALPSLLLRAEDETGTLVEGLPELRLFLRRYPKDAEPEVVELGGLRAGETLVLDDLEAPVGPERWWIWGELASEPRLRVDAYLNFRAPETEPGPPAVLFLDFERSDRLGRGTPMIISALDAEGAWVRSWTARFDFSSSDPDIVSSMPEGRVTGSERGIHQVIVQRSSAPITGETTLRGTVTSTSVAETWIVDLPLPKLELRAD